MRVSPTTLRKTDVRCKSCDYPLWNLAGDTCPECGSDYKPSDFQFAPGSVKYLCPNCDQQYYGTSFQGHLQPPTFECVKCGEQVEMNSMRLLPAEGWEEQDTKAVCSPWVNTKYGFFRRWVSTIGWSHVKQMEFMQGLPLSQPIQSAWWFFVLTQLFCVIVGGAVPAALFFIIISVSSSSAQGVTSPMGAMLGFGFVWILGWVFALGFLSLIWGLLTHATLIVTGGCSYSLGRTCSSIVYSSGTLAMCAIPCVGYNCLIYMALIWWVVSATLMVMSGQRVSGFRASLATLWPPAMIVMLLIGVYGYLIFGGLAASRMAGSGGGPPFMTTVNSLQSQTTLTNLVDRLELLRDRNNQEVRMPWPETLFDLDWGRADSSFELAQLVSGGDLLNVDIVPGKDSFDFSALSGRPLDRALKQLEASSERGDGFQRIGALVYCLPGSAVEVDHDVVDGLWVLAWVASSMDMSPTLVVVTTDGSIMSFFADEAIQSALVAEDANRAEFGLGPIADAVRNAMKSVSRSGGG